MSNSSGKGFLGFILGAAVGAAAGILFAPDKGDKTRERLSKDAQDMSKNVQAGLSEKMDELKSYFNSSINDMKRKFDAVEEKVDEKLKETKESSTKK
ncbi:MAG: YtxH domain-containing protein [Bacteroidales bacterium]|nr:YtxH domain-containing protein [Bacteroidales bacterium]